MGNKPDFYNPIYYSIAKKPFFRYHFPGLADIQVNHSQLHQDLFVLCALAGKREGVYLEIGANEPILISNTFLLENSFSWRGIGIEKNVAMVSRHGKLRRNACLNADALTIDFEACMAEAGMPSVIDYLSVDIDPPRNSLAALLRIPHYRYRFRVITFEHDYSFGGHVERAKSRAFLEQLGYQLVVSDVSWGDHVVEDWWVDPEHTDPETIQELTPSVSEGLHPHDQYFYCWPSEQQPSAAASLPVKPEERSQQLREGICVEGWRDINHSYSLVNQWQLLELLRNSVKVRHRDLKHHSPDWNSNANASGLPSGLMQQILQIPASGPEDHYDAIYRIAHPFNLGDGPADRIFVFMTSELGHCRDYTFIGSTPKEATRRQNLTIITPSHWSRAGLLTEEFQEEDILVLPHGISPDFFYKVDPELRNFYRLLFGFSEEDFVLLNISALTWNKGVDILLQAFLNLKPRYPQLKLVIKDQSNLYGRRLEDVLSEMEKSGRQLPPLEDYMKDVIPVSENLDIEALRALYNACDLYVSPYRGEGFNLPPLEAAACGLPILVSAGGSTDDYFSPSLGLQIGSQLCKAELGMHLAPDLDSLQEAIAAVIEKPGKWGGHKGSKWVHSQFSWQQIGQQLLNHLALK